MELHYVRNEHRNKSCTYILALILEPISMIYFSDKEDTSR